MDALEAYAAGVDAEWRAPLREVDAAIRGAGPELWSRIAYGLLVYSLGDHKRDWVVSVGFSQRGMNVRYLYGTLLDDPDGRLRSGSSTLMTLDLPDPEAVDTEAVAAFTAQAVARFDDHLAAKG